jgi:hypothetical protein
MRIVFLFTLLLPLFCNAQSIQNLDIKNGFLQFKLGDSISNYKSIVNKPDKSTPNRYEVKIKAVSLKHYIDKITLIAENGTIAEIEVLMLGDYRQSYMDAAMKKAYGQASFTEDDPKTDTTRHIIYAVWNGKRVSALAKKTIVDLISVNGRPNFISFEKLLFKKTSDVTISGELSQDFPL